MKKRPVRFIKVVRTARKLKKAGELDGLSNDEIALVIAMAIAEGDPKIDWDKLLEFITKLLPIIIAIFT